ncbi:MAG: tRNA (5-methylaminomethyl-2-thiouridine)(34)-methyltransferase MnmD [Desulfobacterales bacterium]
MILIETQDGSQSVLSEEFGVTYHSKYGAVQESRHVFIEEGLFLKTIGKKYLSILEMGFGTGLNAFLTLVEAEKLNISVHYCGVEKEPLKPEIINALQYPEFLDAADKEAQFKALHQSSWNEEVAITDYFSLCKLHQPFSQVELCAKYDLVYYDAFSPNVQPEFWEEPMLRKVFEALLPKGVLVTYCAKGSFKRALKAVGFEVEALPGPPGKREMTRATKS